MSAHESLIDARYSYVARVSRDGRWPFAWAFRVYNCAGEFVYGEEHIESRRAAEKDAADIVARLGEGRLVRAESGVVYVP